MKLFEQLKSNASRMAVYAILVATALCGIAAPVYALNGEKGDVEPAYMASTVKDRYKAFSVPCVQLKQPAGTRGDAKASPPFLTMSTEPSSVWLISDLSRTH